MEYLEMSEREKNVKDLVRRWRQGDSFANIDKISREDLRQTGGLSLAVFERHGTPSHVGIYGAVTLNELRTVKHICEAIGVVMPATL
jgi:hypothetical protein